MVHGRRARIASALGVTSLLFFAPRVDAEELAGDRPESLPSYVSEKKRMSDADAAKKREGFFVTGLPFFSSDPLNGVGGGATGYVHYNGTRADPFFRYTSYRARLGVKGEYTTGNAAAVALKLDVPFVADTAWRVKVDGKYESAPNNLYFGLTEGTLAPFPHGKYATYAGALGVARAGGPGEAPVVADRLRHMFLEREWMLNLKAERVLFDGNWRVLVGYEIQHLTYGTYEGVLVDATDPATGGSVRVPGGRSLLREDADAGRVFGAGGGRVSLTQLSLMYDTRDFDPDPYRGFFFEWGNEHSAPYTGSEFTFHKMLFQARCFLPIAPRVLRRTLIAARLGYGTIIGGEAPFFEYQDQWSSEGSIRALGGSQTLRGFKANRFLGRTVGFVNVELRHRFADFDAAGQNFTLTLAPFLDLGSVGDEVLVIAPTVRAAAGAGLRIGWNRSTVIVADAAFSREDAQFFINFNQSY
ncbi:MAG: BamA/TamA family outer membrane protein [Labilithrix sp.]|nr:BamA/TamA family outer membrane protein [Labilithrix sp.]